MAGIQEIRNDVSIRALRNINKTYFFPDSLSIGGVLLRIIGGQFINKLTQVLGAFNFWDFFIKLIIFVRVISYLMIKLGYSLLVTRLLGRGSFGGWYVSLKLWIGKWFFDFQSIRLFSTPDLFHHPHMVIFEHEMDQEVIKLL
jgi:hypothetical protein